MSARGFSTVAAAALAVVLFHGWAPNALADTIDPLDDDPLHGFCYGSSSCSDNGTNTPTNSNPPSFGFSISPGPQTGNLFIDILVPNNLVSGPFSITGTQGGASNDSALSAIASLYSATAWTSGQLSTYLGITAAPSNPIGAYLPSTQALDAGATGFFVYQANLGTNQLMANSNELLGPLLNIGDLLKGSYIVGFLAVIGKNGKTSIIATANSGALFETGNPPPSGGSPPSPVPLPAAAWLMVTALAGTSGFSAWRRRRSFRSA